MPRLKRTHRSYVVQTVSYRTGIKGYLHIRAESAAAAKAEAKRRAVLIDRGYKTTLYKVGKVERAS